MSAFLMPYSYPKTELIALDIIPSKIEQLNNKISPIIDVDIQDFLANKNLNFTATLDN